jgi:Fe-S cluster assembly iron-binding protein IscA
MVQISQGATEVLSTLRSTEGIPDSYGVRFYSEKDRDGGSAVGIAFAQAPATGDEVIVAQELPVFVAAEVAAELGDAVLDVESEAEVPRFVIRSEGPA